MDARHNQSRARGAHHGGESSPDDSAQRLGRLYASGNLNDAEALCREILEREPNRFAALHTLGAIHARRGDFADAERLIRQALKADDRSASAWNGHGSALRGLKRFDEALVSYCRAIALRPDFAQAFYNRAGVMHDLGRLEDALADYDKALAIDPLYVRALYNRAGVLQELGRLVEALDVYDKVIALDPRHADAFNSRGIALMKLRRPQDALVSHDQALSLDPGHEQALMLGIAAASQLCDWRDRDRRHKDVYRLLRSGKPIIPFPLLHETDSPALHLEAAASVWRPNASEPHRPRATRGGGSERIRLAYVSADFCDHPVAYAVVELLELHDRSQFEVFAISLTPDDGSAVRRRLEAAVDHFIEVGDKSDEEVATLLAGLGIGIAVDLTGHTRGHRPGIFARRPAPVVVNYLGYPGTSGGECIDYIIADPYVIPEQSEPFYSEKIVRLPHTYFVSDSKRSATDVRLSRSASGLPEDAFVFCCFNNAFKITPEMLTVWARILKGVENSILWLNLGNPTARQSLCREIEARGAPANRMVFAPFAPSLPEHLIRLGNADLFLDTYPYNAHSTACDALYVGVPILTCSGQSFASRVAGSLLNAAGLPELITCSLEDYETLALKLARDPILLRALRQKLIANRTTCPLFATNRTGLHLEAAYRTMWERHCRGLSPQTFSVQPVGALNG